MNQDIMQSICIVSKGMAVSRSWREKNFSWNSDSLYMLYWQNQFLINCWSDTSLPNNTVSIVW